MWYWSRPNPILLVANTESKEKQKETNYINRQEKKIILDFLEAEPADRPTKYLIKDAYWSNESSQKVIRLYSMIAAEKFTFSILFLYNYFFVAWPTDHGQNIHIIDGH